ncbi:MAG: murein biosynthesis integral membrane protein MurJ [Geminicoccaceae bacterium]
MAAVEPGTSSGDKAASRTEETTSLVADSKVVAFWTLFSRVTGFARVAVMAAVLGPTFFGNLFQTTYHIPAIISEILSGSLIAAILVPSLVRCLERRDPAAASRLASGFLGVMFIAGAAVAVSIFLGAPLILSLITAAVADPDIRAQQQEVGWLLLLMLIPQIFLYSLNATNVAIQHAHRRFPLASAGPIVENLGIVAVLLSSAMIFGAGMEIDQVTTAQVLWLGIGCTGSVALQSIVQAWGAYRTGTVVVPHFGRFDPELRRVTGLLLPSSGYAILNGLVYLALFIVAGRLPGGALAVQIGWNVFNLPVALCARPVVAAQLPRLSSNRANQVTFNQIYRSSLGLVAFMTLPVSILLVGMGDYAARLIAYGEMSNADSIAMIGAAIMGMGVGVIGNSIVLIGTSSSYALDRPWWPFQSQVIWAVIAGAGMTLAWTSMSGIGYIFALTLSVSVGYLVAGAYLHWRQAYTLPPVKDYAAVQFLADLVIAAMATFPAILACSWLIDPSQSIIAVASVAGVAVILSGCLYLLMQWARGSNEFSAIFALRGMKFANGP